MNDRDRAELYRAMGAQFARSPELHRLMAAFATCANAAAAWVEQMDRQTQDVVAALNAKLAEFDAQMAEMFLGIVSALDAHRVSISIPVSKFLVRRWIRCAPILRWFPTIYPR